MTIDDLHNRWTAWCERIPSSTKSDISEYPPDIEPIVQKAIHYKHCGQYLESIIIYMDIIETHTKMYPDLLKALYKSVLCTGHLYFAYEVIVMAECLAKFGWGMRPSSNNPFLALILPNEEWQQTISRKELEEKVLQYLEYSSCTPSELKLRSIINDFETLIGPYSGQDYYKLPDDFSQHFCNTLRNTIDKIVEMHRKYKQIIGE